MARRKIQQQYEGILAEAQDKITGQASEPAQTAIGDSNRVKEGVRPAYRTYLEAKKAGKTSKTSIIDPEYDPLRRLFRLAADIIIKLEHTKKYPLRRLFRLAGENATVEKELAKKGLAETQDKITRQASEPAQTAIGDSNRVKERFRPAYRTYLEARKNLAEALKQRVRQDEEAYREAEQRYQLCEEAIEMAIKLREKAELNALDAYTEEVAKAIHKASQAYKDKMNQARIECKQRIIDAGRDSNHVHDFNNHR